MTRWLWVLFAGAVFSWAGEPHPGLKNPSKAVKKAPETYRVLMKTTKGDFTVVVHRAWAPLAADRFYNLVEIGFFDNMAFYRVVKGFCVQFGYTGDPEINLVWREATIKDEPVVESNTAGRLSFASRGNDTRTTQIFINTYNNAHIDDMGFPPFGEVEGEGLAIIKQLYHRYGDSHPFGKGPNQEFIEKQGKAYLEKNYPELDYILSAGIIKDDKE